MTRFVAFLGCAIVVGCNAIFGVDELRPAEQHEGGATSASASTRASASTASSSVSSTGNGGGPADCEECARSTAGCEAEKVACAAAPECAALSQCLADCADSVCRSDCLEQFASGIPALYAEYDCVRCTGPCRTLCQQECASCGVDCGECANSNCAQTACHESFQACKTHFDCIPFSMCLMNCGGDPMCEDSCANMYPLGAVVYFDLVRCVGCSWDTCYEACDGAMACVP